MGASQRAACRAEALVAALDVFNRSRSDAIREDMNSGSALGVEPSYDDVRDSGVELLERIFSSVDMASRFAPGGLAPLLRKKSTTAVW